MCKYHLEEGSGICYSGGCATVPDYGVLGMCEKVANLSPLTEVQKLGKLISCRS
jgi:hypothetical protein